MNVVLQVRNGALAGRVFQLKEGQTARFGSSEWADFPLPEAEGLAGEHFALECGAGECRVRSLVDGLDTLLNGAPATDATLAHGDVLAAGAVEFAVFIEGAETEPDSNAAAGNAESAAPPPPAGPVELCAELGLSGEAAPIAAAQTEVPAFVDALVAADLFDDAVRVTAHGFGARKGVWWAVGCVRAAQGSVLQPADVAALEAAAKWVEDPTDAHRRAANAAAEATDYSTGATWVALAAFWSAGSLAPAGLPDSPPPENLAVQGIAGGLALAATAGPPDAAADRYRTFLTTARDLEGQGIDWE